jgi:hypothetical protein
MALMPRNQNGFIPMIICILLVIGALIYVAYSRVQH